MTKLKHKFHYDEVYEMGFCFLLNVKDDAEVEKILKRSYPKTWKFYKKEKAEDPLGLSIKNCAGKNIQSADRQIIIVRKGKKYDYAYWHSVLAHESLHAVMDTFNRRGVRLASNPNEHATYYLDHLIRIALEK